MSQSKCVLLRSKTSYLNARYGHITRNIYLRRIPGTRLNVFSSLLFDRVHMHTWSASLRARWRYHYHHYQRRTGEYRNGNTYPHHPRLSIQQQCELLGVPRSTYYYQPQPESAENWRSRRRFSARVLRGFLDCLLFNALLRRGANVGRSLTPRISLSSCCCASAGPGGV
jgi:hypothetical protein